MKRTWIWISVLVLPTLALPCHAGGIFFKKRNRTVDPATRVPELLFVLKSERSASKRADAAEELRRYDVAAHPEMVPALVGTLQSDGSWMVRREAAKTLGRIRPVSATVGQALQKTVKDDSNMLVRLQARSSLWAYYLGGYRSSDEPAAKKPEEMNQPAAPTNGNPVVQNPPDGPALATPGKEPGVVIIGPKQETPKPTVARPLPKGQPWSTAVPAEPLRQTPAPPVIVEEEPNLEAPPVEPPKF